MSDTQSFSDLSSEEFPEDLWSDDENLFLDEGSHINIPEESSHVLSLFEESCIPKDVFMNMEKDELIQYIFQQGETPTYPHDKYILVDQAYNCQKFTIQNELALFQLQRYQELESTVKSIAMVEDRERMRTRWYRTISKLPVDVTRTVVVHIVKHVILLNDVETINNVRRVTRDFKSVMDSTASIEAIHVQNRKRNFEKVIQKYDDYFGDDSYFFINYRTINLYQNWLKDLDFKIYNKFLDYGCHLKFGYERLYYFRAFCRQKQRRLQRIVNEKIKLIV